MKTAVKIKPLCKLCSLFFYYFYSYEETISIVYGLLCDLPVASCVFCHTNLHYKQ